MSALPPKADIDGRRLDVRFVPKADMTLRDVGFTPEKSAAVFEPAVCQRHIRCNVEELDCLQLQREMQSWYSG
jgi:hypothetical protein